MKIINRAVYFLGAVFILGVVAVMAQTGEGSITPPPEFPLILLVPYFFGTLIHWAKKYVETRAQTGEGITFAGWFLKDGVMTLVSIVVGVGALWGLFQANPEFYSQGNLGVWIQVILTGIAGDTLNTVRPASANG